MSKRSNRDYSDHTDREWFEGSMPGEPLKVCFHVDALWRSDVAKCYRYGFRVVGRYGITVKDVKELMEIGRALIVAVRLVCLEFPEHDRLCTEAKYKGVYHCKDANGKTQYGSGFFEYPYESYKFDRDVIVTYSDGTTPQRGRWQHRAIKETPFKLEWLRDGKVDALHRYGPDTIVINEPERMAA